MARSRIFTPSEEQNRDAWIHERIENDCVYCDETYDGCWTPSEACPVHGLKADEWFVELNVELDRRWPGRWVDAVERVSV